MFGRKRDISPYEIMRPGGREARKQPAGAWRSPRRAEGGGGTDFQGLRDWLAGGEPVVLRLPKGVALSLIGGVLLLILVAYWVGFARGGAAADSRHEQFQASQEAARRSIPVPLITEDDRPNPPNDARPAGSPADPRLAGLNYLILAQYPEEEARRLAAFLGGRGVETFLTTSHNARLFLVVAAQGFERTDAGPAQAYEDRLHAFGREWKTQERGSDDLGTMWWKKHK